MRTRDLDRRNSLGARILGGLDSRKIVVGALAIAAIVLAFSNFGSGQTSQEAKPSATAAGPTVAPAAVIPIPTAAPTPSPPRGRVHVVVSGDTLSGLAQKYYGDASKWEKVFEANKDVLSSPGSLQVGQKLKIPD